MKLFNRQSSMPSRRVIVLAIVACMATDMVGAREGGRRGAVAHMASDRGARQAERAQQRALQRQAQEHPVEAAPVPAVPVVQPPPDRSRPGRLTPDERRALRQQINEAGREIYRPDRP